MTSSPAREPVIGTSAAPAALGTLAAANERA